MGKQIQAKRDNAIAMVKAGTWAADDTYRNRDGMGAYTRGMLEPYEAQAKAAGLGIWANASQADRSAAANYRAPVKVAAKSDQRAAALGVDPRAYAASGGRVQAPIGNQATGNWGSPQTSTAQAGKLLPQTTPQPRATGFALQAVAPTSTTRKQILDELNRLNGYSIEFGGAVAERNMPRIQQLSEELNRIDAASSQAQRQPVAPKGYGPTDSSWGQDYGPASADVAAARQATATEENPTTASRALIPTESAYEGLQNRYDEAYTGRLLSAARSQAEREAANGAERLRKSMAERGLSQAGISGFEVQGLRDIEMARQNNLGRLSNEVYNNAADKATAFDTQRAGALDAFGMNRGNLSLGFAADARAGMLIPAQVRAANAGAGSAESQALIDNQNAYEYGKQESANNRGARDNLQTLLAGSQYEGASIANAMRGMDYQTQRELLETTIDAAKAQGAIQETEANAARQILAQNGMWYEQGWAKNILRGLLVGGGALIGGLTLGPGGAVAGGIAGAKGAAELK